jgi:hypothetical protein
MLTITREPYRVLVGERLAVSFQRTLRIPEDGRTYPLPPGLGAFPVCAVADYLDRAPAWLKDRGGFFLPMYRREAMWIGFDAASWKPNAVQVGAGGVNAVSGESWGLRLNDVPQNYLVCPPQLWLDGINAGAEFVRQFVATPLGLGDTVEGQVTGSEEVGGIQIKVYEPKPGRFPDEPPQRVSTPAAPRTHLPQGGNRMGLGAGGRMRQKIYPDQHGIDTWNQDDSTQIFVHIIGVEAYRELTGQEPPPTPVDAGVYAKHKLPWFELYDEDLGDVAAASALSRVETLGERDRTRGAGEADSGGVEVSESSIRKITPPR